LVGEDEAAVSQSYGVGEQLAAADTVIAAAIDVYLKFSAV